MADARVLAVNGDDLLALKDEVAGLVAAGPADAVPFEASLRAHVRKPGFRACTARGTDGRLVGFAYGWEGGPGEWWWDIVAGVVNEDVRRRWFADCFQLAELTVLPEVKRSGIGTALHDAVLDLTERPHAVLSTRCDDGDALAFFATNSWRTVVTAMRFPGSDEPFAILVRDRRG
jgi:GNAT superfamily N-acetyltransferase